LRKSIQFVAYLFLFSAIGLAQTSGKVSVTSPISGSTVTSPAHFVASAQAPANRHISAMRIYVDYKSVYSVQAAKLDTYVTMTQGSHKVTVQAWDSSGSVYKKSLSLTVSGSTPTPTPSPTPGPAISVSISPSSATVQSSQSRQFTASVTGTTNTTINWQAGGITGGNSTIGLISSTGLYTAPANVPPTNPVVVTARSAYDTTAAANATVTITSSTTSNGKDYYVSTTGSDSNDGSVAHPWRTIRHAAAMAQAGMTIHVAPGTYNEHVVSTVSGTSSDRIVFISDTKWAAKVVGLGCTAVGPAYSCPSGYNSTWWNRGDYVDIRGFDITGDGHIGIQNDAANVQELDNHIHNITGPGACIGYTGGIAGIDNTNANNPGSGLKNNNVIGNWVHDIGWDGTHFCGGGGHGVYQASPGGKVQNNLLYRGSGQGVTMWHYATNIVITNNTIFRFGDGIVIGADPSTGVYADYCIVNNNIVRNNNLGIRTTGSVGTHNTYSHNLVYQNSSNISLASGNIAVNTIVADPLFVNWQIAGGGNYHLQSGSPAIDAGTNSFAPLIGFDGEARPWGANWDIGAYEYGSAPAVWPW